MKSVHDKAKGTTNIVFDALLLNQNFDHGWLGFHVLVDMKSRCYCILNAVPFVHHSLCPQLMRLFSSEKFLKHLPCAYFSEPKQI